MKPVLAVFMACAAVAVSAPLQAVAADALPENLPAIATDADALGRLYERLEKSPPNDLATLGWLLVHAGSIPPPIRYLYASKLQANGLTDQALIELARARLARDLDAAECVDRRRMDVMLQITDLVEQQMHAETGRDLKRWLKAIGTVLADADSRQTSSAVWLCGPNNLKPADLASKDRQGKFEFLRADYERHLAEERVSAAASGQPSAPPAPSRAIPVLPGDTLEKLRAAYPGSPPLERMAAPDFAPSAAEDKYQLRLRTKGLWYFLNRDNVVYTVRVEPPYPGNLELAPVKLPFDEVRRAWGEPAKSFRGRGITSYIFERTDAYSTRVDVDPSGQVVMVFLMK